MSNANHDNSLTTKGGCGISFSGNYWIWLILLLALRSDNNCNCDNYLLLFIIIFILSGNCGGGFGGC